MVRKLLISVKWIWFYLQKVFTIRRTHLVSTQSALYAYEVDTAVSMLASFRHVLQTEEETNMVDFEDRDQGVTSHGTPLCCTLALYFNCSSNAKVVKKSLLWLIRAQRFGHKLNDYAGTMNYFFVLRIEITARTR